MAPEATAICTRRPTFLSISLILGSCGMSLGLSMTLWFVLSSVPSCHLLMSKSSTSLLYTWIGMTSFYMAGIRAGESPTVAPASLRVVDGKDDEDDDDEGPESGDLASGSLSVVKLAARYCMSDFISCSHRHSNPNFK